jgi:hypothetical protein
MKKLPPSDLTDVERHILEDLLGDYLDANRMDASYRLPDDPLTRAFLREVDRFFTCEHEGPQRSQFDLDSAMNGLGLIEYDKGAIIFYLMHRVVGDEECNCSARHNRKAESIQ